MAPHLASTNATGKGASLAVGSGESLPLASAHMTLYCMQHYCWLGSRYQGFHVIFTVNKVLGGVAGRGSFLLLRGDESPSSPLGLLGYHLVGGIGVVSLLKSKGRAVGFPWFFSGMGWVGLQCFLLFVQGREGLLKVFWITLLPLFLVLWLKRTNFSGPLFDCTCWCFQVAKFLSGLHKS